MVTTNHHSNVFVIIFSLLVNKWKANTNHLYDSRQAQEALPGLLAQLLVHASWMQ